MAGSKLVMSNAVVAAALVALLVAAAAPGAAAYHACGVDTDELVKQCRSYCRVGSTDASPSDLCCKAVSGCQYGCLCRYQSVLPSDIDRYRAMRIPSMCGVNGAPSACPRA